MGSSSETPSSRRALRRERPQCDARTIGPPDSTVKGQTDTTFQVDGQQYVAIATGRAIFSFALPE
jgi:hypothetical protein